MCEEKRIKNNQRVENFVVVPTTFLVGFFVLKQYVHRYIWVTEVSCPSSDGIVPVNELVSKSKNSTIRSIPNSVGIVPVKSSSSIHKWKETNHTQDDEDDDDDNIDDRNRNRSKSSRVYTFDSRGHIPEKSHRDTRHRGDGEELDDWLDSVIS